MTHEWTKQAARNNAAWCEAVCGAHGRPGECLDGVWINRRETPLFYPNVVTLSDSGSAAQIECIRHLVAAGIPGEWAVKDSFSRLDLAPLGFRISFEAQWIYRPVSAPQPRADVVGIRWIKIEDAMGLADWESAWGGTSTNEQLSRIFMPALLVDEDVAVIAAYRDRHIVAGVIANRAADAVGLSNLFVSGDGAEIFRAGCVAAVIDAFPGLPVVGYESGADLTGSLALGFETVGPLRVWVHGSH